ncbi:hypothetical protein AAVH_23705 [Aphelenchoides avenae]|nr:hypothetical protein AAVH_23705 [Aphelenchus avenae]
MPSQVEIDNDNGAEPASQAAAIDSAPIAGDDVATTKQTHELLKQRILSLQAELQLKDDALQEQLKRAQISSGIISSLRERLQTQGTNFVGHFGQYYTSGDSNLGISVAEGSK